MAKAKQNADALNFFYKARSPSQKAAELAWKQSRILFFQGKAGSGKTSAALGMAIREALELKEKEERGLYKLWLARPAVVCGENLGFNPGSLSEKIEPWLAPLQDCFDSLSTSSWETLGKWVKVEAISVGMLRGRTIRNGTLLIDEAQQLTENQMRCALTRLGEYSRIVLCGDSSQSDRFQPDECPFADAARKLSHLDLVSVVTFKEQLRDPLIDEILKAY